MSTKSTRNSKNSITINQRLRSRFGEAFFVNVPLAQYVSAQVGGVAEYVVIATTGEDIVEAVRIALAHRVEFRVIGGGTGTLPSEVGFPGLIIINQTTGIAFTQGTSVVVVASGVSNQTLVARAASKDLGGIEFLCGVPGSVGGAVATNATYAGASIGAFVKDVTLIASDGREPQIITIPASELQFKPYQSVLLGESAYPPIILNARLQLARLPQEEIMRRLRQYRTRTNQITISAPHISTYVRPPLEEQTAFRKGVRSVRLPGVRLDTESGIISATSPKITARLFRQYIRLLQEFYQGYGVTLEDRITYLGYWPPMEGSEDDSKS